MARPTGDSFVPDMVVAYGVPFEPETWPSRTADAQCLWMDGTCGPCSQGPPGCARVMPPLSQMPTPEEEARNVRNALIAFGVVAAIAIPAAVYVLYRERRGA